MSDSTTAVAPSTPTEEIKLSGAQRTILNDLPKATSRNASAYKKLTELGLVALTDDGVTRTEAGEALIPKAEPTPEPVPAVETPKVTKVTKQLLGDALSPIRSTLKTGGDRLLGDWKSPTFGDESYPQALAECKRLCDEALALWERWNAQPKTATAAPAPKPVPAQAASMAVMTRAMALKAEDDSISLEDALAKATSEVQS